MEEPGCCDDSWCPSYDTDVETVTLENGMWLHRPCLDSMMAMGSME